MLEPVITVQFPDGVATLRDRHWHVPGNLDLERDLNDLYPMGGDLANPIEKEAELVALEFDGVVVSVERLEQPRDVFVVDLDRLPARPEPEGVLVVALPDAPEGLTQGELDELATEEFTQTLGEPFELPPENPSETSDNGVE